MTVPRLAALNRHWERHPPTPLVARAIAEGLGILKPYQPPARSLDEYITGLQAFKAAMKEARGG